VAPPPCVAAGEVVDDAVGRAVVAGATVGVGPGGRRVGPGVDVGLAVGWADGRMLAAGEAEADGLGVASTGVGDGVVVGASSTSTTMPTAGSGSEPEASARKTSSQAPAGSIVLVRQVPFVSSPATNDIGSGGPPSPTISTETDRARRASGSLT
jgi:hypothetical protein